MSRLAGTRLSGDEYARRLRSYLLKDALQSDDEPNHVPNDTGVEPFNQLLSFFNLIFRRLRQLKRRISRAYGIDDRLLINSRYIRRHVNTAEGNDRRVPICRYV